MSKKIGGEKIKKGKEKEINGCCLPSFVPLEEDIWAMFNGISVMKHNWNLKKEVK